VDILIEAVGGRHGETPLALLQTLWSRRIRGVIATVIARRNLDVNVGERAAQEEGVDHLIFAPSGAAVFGDPAVRNEIRAALAERQSRQFRFVFGPAQADIFIEVILPPLQLFIFGAGADVTPLASLATFLGWRVTVVDMRGGPTGTQRSFAAEQVIRCNEQSFASLAIPAEAAAVVMNHNWNGDLTTLRRLLAEPLGYLGILGPRKRTDRLISRTGAKNRVAQNVRYPIGLDIGAKTPSEIALAIVAEITSVMHGADGGALSARPGPIHLRDESEYAAPAIVTSATVTGEICPVAGS
jgi:xanthine/CO dehydrogenase XdhC/CoxF family maturation factor